MKTSDLFCKSYYLGTQYIEGNSSNFRAEPYSLPSGFFWDTLDLGVESILEEVYKLLTENYVEDDDNMFRFNYSPEFLLWALRPPEFQPNWHVGVRTASSKKLVGFISGVPATIQVAIMATFTDY